MAVTPITSVEDFRRIINSGKVVVIDFWAPWCGPCRVISPFFESISAKPEYGDKLEFYKVDADEQPDIAEEVNIRSMPTFIAFKDGKKVADLIGALPERLQTLVTEAAQIS